jgi:hypothetical protein
MKTIVSLLTLFIALSASAQFRNRAGSIFPYSTALSSNEVFIIDNGTTNKNLRAGDLAAFLGLSNTNQNTAAAAGTNIIVLTNSSGTVFTIHGVLSTNMPAQALASLIRAQWLADAGTVFGTNGLNLAGLYYTNSTRYDGRPGIVWMPAGWTNAALEFAQDPSGLKTEIPFTIDKYGYDFYIMRNLDYGTNVPGFTGNYPNETVITNANASLFNLGEEGINFYVTEARSTNYRWGVHVKPMVASIRADYQIGPDEGYIANNTPLLPNFQIMVPLVGMYDGYDGIRPQYPWNCSSNQPIIDLVGYDSFDPASGDITRGMMPRGMLRLQQNSDDPQYSARFAFLRNNWGWLKTNVTAASVTLDTKLGGFDWWARSGGDYVLAGSFEAIAKSGPPIAVAPNSGWYDNNPRYIDFVLYSSATNSVNPTLTNHELFRVSWNTNAYSGSNVPSILVSTPGMFVANGAGTNWYDGPISMWSFIQRESGEDSFISGGLYGASQTNTGNIKAANFYTGGNVVGNSVTAQTVNATISLTAGSAAIPSGATIYGNVVITNGVILMKAQTTFTVPSGYDGYLINSNKVLYWVTATKTNMVSDGQ